MTNNKEQIPKVEDQGYLLAEARAKLKKIEQAMENLIYNAAMSLDYLESKEVGKITWQECLEHFKMQVKEIHKMSEAFDSRIYLRV